MNQKTISIIGVVMILLGSGMLFYRGYNVTREETVLNVGSLDVKATTRERVPIPAPVGWAFVAGGILALGSGFVWKTR